MKAAYNSIETKVVSGYDIVFVARNTISEQKEMDVERAMFGAVRAAGLMS